MLHVVMYATEITTPVARLQEVVLALSSINISPVVEAREDIEH